MAVLLGLVDLVGWIAVSGLLIAAVNFGYIVFWHAVTPGVKPPTSQPLVDYPHVLVQIPVFNETRVVTETARSAARNPLRGGTRTTVAGLNRSCRSGINFSRHRGSLVAMIRSKSLKKTSLGTPRCPSYSRTVPGPALFACDI